MLKSWDGSAEAYLYHGGQTAVQSKKRVACPGACPGACPVAFPINFCHASFVALQCVMITCGVARLRLSNDSPYCPLFFPFIFPFFFCC